MQLSRQKDNEEVFLSRCAGGLPLSHPLLSPPRNVLRDNTELLCISVFVRPCSPPSLPPSPARSLALFPREGEGDRGRVLRRRRRSFPSPLFVLAQLEGDDDLFAPFSESPPQLLESEGQRQGGREGALSELVRCSTPPVLPPSLPSLSVFSLIPDDSVLALMEANSIFRDCSRVIRGGGVRGRQVFCSFPTSFPLPFLSFGHFLLVEVVPCPTRS